MRIIAGEFRGRRLAAPKGEGTRPTTDRVREALMSVLASARGALDGAVVLDAFAGSGALGLEALSRGAAAAVFCERDGAALRTLRANVEAVGLAAPRARVVRTDVLEHPPAAPGAPFDLVFLDPPYALGAMEALGVPAALAARGALSVDALVVYEHVAASCGAADEAAAARGLSLAQRKKYGDTVVDVLRPAAPDAAE